MPQTEQAKEILSSEYYPAKICMFITNKANKHTYKSLERISESSKYSYLTRTDKYSILSDLIKIQKSHLNRFVK